MKTAPKLIQVLLIVAMLSITLAHHFTGTYQNQQGINLTIKHSGDGQMQGVFVMQGQQFQLQGQGNQEGAFGVLMGEGSQFGFQAQVSPDLNTLQMMLFPADAEGKPDTSRSQQLTLQRSQKGGSNIPIPPPNSNPIPNPNPIPPPNPNPIPPPNPLPTPTGWDGTYSDGQLTMTLQSANPLQQNGAYQGFIELGDTQYPMQATESLEGLNGKFLSGSNEFTLSVVRQEDKLVLTTGGREYILTSQTQQSGGNPLGN